MSSTGRSGARRSSVGSSPAVALAGAGLLAQVVYPLTGGALRAQVTVAVVLLLAAACVAHAAAVRGMRWAAGLVAVTCGGGLLVEYLGTTTGLPFGGYAYTAAGALGPELGPVPLLIGPAWTMGAYPAWCAARAVCGPGRGVRTVLLAAWGLAAWDLYLDPQMVADGRWRWADPSPALPGVPDVPLSNHLGWLAVAVAMAAALHAIDRVRGEAERPHDGLPLALYCWTWLGSAAAHVVLLGLPASGAYGLVAMGVLGVPLLRRVLAAEPGAARASLPAVGRSPAVR